MPYKDKDLVEIMVPSHLKARMKEIASSKKMAMSVLVARCLNAYCREEGIHGAAAERPVSVEDMPRFMRPKSLRGRPRRVEG
jgi:hypothetical protein